MNMNPTKILAIMAVVVVIVAGLVWYIYRDSEYTVEIDTDINLSKIFSRGGVETTDYRNPDLGLAFTYRLAPDGYVAVTPSSLTAGTILTVSLFRENEYLELLESSETRKAPPAITVEVFSGRGFDLALDWIRNSRLSNFDLATGEPAPVLVGGIPAQAYTYSGLYEAKSLVAIYGGNVYVFSVQYLSPADKIISDFDEMIKTVRFNEVSLER